MNHFTEKDFENLFEKYFNVLVNYAYKYMKDWDAAKDIVHQAYIKLWTNRQNLNLSQNLVSYLYTTVYHLMINYIRDNKRFLGNEQTLDTLTQTINADDQVQHLELMQKVFTVIQSLPPKMREVFILSRYEKLSYKQIAKRLNISVKTVENHISNALKILRKKLKDYL